MSSCKSQDLLNAYYCMFVLFLSVFLLFAMLSRGKLFSDVWFYNIFLNSADHFMDFFNSVRDASKLSVYKNGIIYPPLVNMMYFFISKLVSAELVSAPFYYRTVLRDDQVGMMVYIILALICIVTISKIIDAYFESIGLIKHNRLVSFVLILSYPMIYCLERGNCALVALALTMFFVFFRNSENKYIRELSYILLAIAAGIKIYPAVFGILLITDKKYKEAARLAVYGVILFFLPFFFYDGFGSIKDIYHNLIEFNNNKSSFNIGNVSITIIAFIAEFLGLDKDFWLTVGNTLFVITETLAVAAVFLLPKSWQKAAAIVYLIMNISAVSDTYNVIFYLIPFILFLTQKDGFRKVDIIYFLMFALLMIPIPAFYYFNHEALADKLCLFFDAHLDISYYFTLYIKHCCTRFNQLIYFPIVQGMFVMLLIESVKRAVRMVKKRRASKIIVECVLTEVS